MPEPLFELDARARVIVLDAMREVAACRRWRLIAAHVRSRQVHVVVDTSGPPARARGNFKAYTTRRMIEQGIEPHRRRRWARSGHASRSLDRAAARAAVAYVVEEQGEPMAVYRDPEWPCSRSIPAPGQPRAFLASPG